MRKLEDSQVESFDTEYVNEKRWLSVKACLDKDFPSGKFRFLDVGGGNGKFADLILREYPEAVGTVLDNSEVLLSRNVPNDRKTLVSDSVENLLRLSGKFDLISVNWLLHHLVGDSFSETKANQLNALRNMRALLSPGGRISVFENIYLGWLFTDLPTRLIYQLTSLKSISALTKRFGANTAGVGVCFLSQRQWDRTFNKAGLAVDSYEEPDEWTRRIRLAFKLLLHLKEVRVGHYWLQYQDLSRGGY